MPGDVWTTVVVVLVTVAAVVRDLVAVHRLRTRHAALRRLADVLGPGGPVIDAGPDGRTTIVTGRCPVGGASGPAYRRGREAEA